MQKLTQLHYAIKHNTHPSFNFTHTQIKQLWQNPNSLSMTRVLKLWKTWTYDKASQIPFHSKPRN